MPYSYIPEGCIIFGPQSALIFTFSDRFLTILHAIYLVSNKVALNQAKNTVFLHLSYICTIIYVHAFHYHQHLNFSTLFDLEDGKKPGCRGPCHDGDAPPEGQRRRPALSGLRRDEHDVGGLPPRAVATTEPVTRRTRPIGRTATGREQRASRREDGRRGHGRDRNFYGKEERNGGTSTTKMSDEREGGASVSIRRAAGASAGRETKYFHRRGGQHWPRTNDHRAAWLQHTLCCNFKHRKE